MFFTDNTRRTISWIEFRWHQFGVGLSVVVHVYSSMEDSPSRPPTRKLKSAQHAKSPNCHGAPSRPVSSAYPNQPAAKQNGLATLSHSHGTKPLRRLSCIYFFFSLLAVFVNYGAWGLRDVCSPPSAPNHASASQESSPPLFSFFVSTASAFKFTRVCNRYCPSERTWPQMIASKALRTYTNMLASHG